MITAAPPPQQLPGWPRSASGEGTSSLADESPQVLVTEAAFLERAFAIRASDGDALPTIVCIGEAREGTLRWGDLLKEAGDLREFAATAPADDLLTIIYTSGTTGPPKGVELTHANVLAQLRATSAGLGLADRMRVVSYLPMAHIAERLLTHYLPIAHGRRVTTYADALESRGVGQAHASGRSDALPARRCRSCAAPGLSGYEEYADDMRLELLPGVGHFVCEPEPERAAARLVEFLSARHPKAITAV